MNIKKVLIVGNGYAGKLHAKAWKELGHHVEFLDDTACCSVLDVAMEVYNPDIVDFCNSPRFRIDMLYDHIHLFKDKDIYVEKPPCRP